MTRYATLPEPEVGVWLRLYIYGLHGFLIEVLFTAVWDFVVHRDWALVGEYRCVLFTVCPFLPCRSSRPGQRQPVCWWRRSFHVGIRSYGVVTFTRIEKDGGVFMACLFSVER